MYYHIKYAQNTNTENNEEASMSKIRVLNAVPDAPYIDVYANNELIAKNLKYGDYTDYISINSGIYEIRLYLAGTNSIPVITNLLNVTMNTVCTIACTGMLSNVSFLEINDYNTIKEPIKALVRFAHLSPNASVLDITLQNGNVLVRNLSFQQVTNYVGFIPMNYTVQVRSSSTSTVILTISIVDLEPYKFYTVYIIGLLGAEPRLDALQLTDG